MKLVLMSLVLALAVPAVSGATQTPQQNGPSASAPAFVRLDGEFKSATGEARSGSVVVVISLYGRPDDTAPLWTESQAVTLDAAGRYTVFAGATQAEGLPRELFAVNAAQWIGVALQGEPEQPRVRMVSVPYALSAGNADTLGGVPVTDFVMTDNLAASVKKALTGADATAAAVGDPTIMGTAGRIAKFNSGGVGDIVDSVMFESAGGNVGIGTTTPSENLTIVAPTSATNQLAFGVAGEDKTFFYRTNATGFNFYGAGAVGANVPIHFFTGGGAVDERLTILGTGNVGIGVSNPTSKLHVVGTANITGDVTVGGNIGAKYQDVAEWVETGEPLEMGTVVIVAASVIDQVVPSQQAYDTRVAGAVSRQPGLILGERGDSKSLIAQSGRVRIKVDATYGAIKAGDLLVTSPTPGHAMLSKPMKIGKQLLHRPGTLVGKALEGLPNGRGEILVLLTLQ